MNDDFVKVALFKWLPNRRKGPSGWEIMNCIMCHLNGEPSKDKKRKAGVIFSGSVFTYHCFRCQYKAHWHPGMLITNRLKRLLKASGCPDNEIYELGIQSLKLQQETNYEPYDPIKKRISFDEIELPPNSKSISEWANDSSDKFLEVAQYLISRNVRTFDNFYWTPNIKNQMTNRVIIPFYHENKIVGYTARFIKNKTPTGINKYHTSSPNGYLFNNHFIDNRDRKYIMLVEGPFDALAIDGVAYLSNTLTKLQVEWLRNSDKEKILIPDKDSAGLDAIDVAIENNWSVSFPDWEEGVDDVDKAVNKYGVLWTVQNILDSRTNNSTQIQVEAKLWL